MTGRTHDLAAFTALTFVFVYTPLIHMSLATLVVSLATNFIGGLYPDLDNASSSLWKKIRGGSILGKLISPLMGGHRMISHSLLGVGITAFFLHKFLFAINHILIVDMNIVWQTFMIGYLSHLITDAITKEGIPLFFPLPINIGIPPLKALRIKTGGRIEKSIIYPGLMLLTGYLIFQHSNKVLEFLQSYLSK